MPRAVEAVMLEGGLVEVTPIRWGHWNSLKEQFAELLGSRLVPEVLGLLGRIEAEASDEGEAEKGNLEWASWMSERVEQLSGDLGAMLADAVRSIDGLMLILIEGCTRDCDCKDLTAIEAIQLAEAAMKASDLPGLLAREKNFFAAVVTAATAKAKTTTAESSGTK